MEHANELRILRQALCDEVKAARPEMSWSTAKRVLDASMLQKTFARRIVFRAISWAYSAGYRAALEAAAREIEECLEGVQPAKSAAELADHLTVIGMAASIRALQPKEPQP